jgi:hypothetical protein
MSLSGKPENVLPTNDCLLVKNERKAKQRDGESEGAVCKYIYMQ